MHSVDCSSTHWITLNSTFRFQNSKRCVFLTAILFWECSGGFLCFFLLLCQSLHGWPAGDLSWHRFLYAFCMRNVTTLILLQGAHCVSCASSCDTCLISCCCCSVNRLINIPPFKPILSLISRSKEIKMTKKQTNKQTEIQ